jgi:cell wall-associated NlpC family hydrolase
MMRKTGTFTLGRFAALLLVGMVVAPGCAVRAPVVHAPGPEKPGSKLAMLGYSIQAGAFADVDNAVRLAASLEVQGLNAHYFLHEEGLYRVRFGDFQTGEEALERAENLVASGVIETYYIVRPEDYTAARAVIQGDAILRDGIVQTAKRFVGLPYRWGGTSPEKGFDCSGLTTAVYQLNGLDLPRSSAEQFRVGTVVIGDGLNKGDLVFFAVSGGRRVSHVGIYTGDGRFVHAPGRGKAVREDLLSDAYYKARYRGGRTYL